MCAKASKGNNPVLWEKLLAELEDKLQLGLLDRLRRVTAYHFEGDILILKPSSPQDEEYFKRQAINQTLKLFAEKIADVSKVRID